MKKFINLESILILILVVIALPLLLWNIGKQEVKNWDEATNANVVYETISNGSHLTLVYENHPFYEKPPLWYWLTMVSVKIFGFNEFGIRFVTIAASISLLTLIYAFSKYHFNYKVGFFACLTILATQQFFQVDYKIFSTHSLRSADLDSLQLAFMMASYFCYTIRSKADNYKYLATLLTGLAVMTKGPIGFLPFILHIIYSVIKDKNVIKSTKTFLKNEWLHFIILALVVLPWHVYQYINYGNDFIEPYLNYHLLNRAFSVIEDHPGGLSYYINLIMKPGFFFSGGLLFISIAWSIKTAGLKIIKEYRYFLIIFGTIAPLILLTLIQTKLPWYLFYVYPFAAICIGVFVAEIFTDKKFQVNKYFFILKIAVILLFAVNIYFNFKYIASIKNLDYCTLDVNNIHQNRSLQFAKNKVGEELLLKYCYFKLN